MRYELEDTSTGFKNIKIIIENLLTEKTENEFIAGLYKVSDMLKMKLPRSKIEQLIDFIKNLDDYQLPQFQYSGIV